MTVDSLRQRGLLIDTFAPRPLVWVTTVNADNTVNMAPYCALTLAANNPPMLIFVVQRRADGSRKRTAENLLANGSFVLNAPTEAMLGALMRSASPGISAEARPESAGVTFEQTGNLTAPAMLGARWSIRATVTARVDSGHSEEPDIFFALLEDLPEIALHQDDPSAFVGALGYEWFVTEKGPIKIAQPYLWA